jgi:hypothetical protein
MMKLERKHKNLIIIGIGLIFILFGLLQVVFKFEVSKNISDRVSFILMMIALVVFMSNRNRKSDTEDDDGENIENTEDIENIESDDSDSR